MKKILIVDDEQSLAETLSNVLEDEGFEVSQLYDGHLVLEQLESFTPDLIILDIWLPGVDGLELLKSILKVDPTIPVIMISGHATIATALHATKIGAVDFIEKPLDLDMTLEKVNSALNIKFKDLTNASNINPVVYAQPALKENDQSKTACIVETSTPQKTLSRSCVLYGLGVHSGQKSGLLLEPLPENSGIHFVGVASQFSTPAYLDYVSTTGFATTIKHKDTQVSTIEHLLSALHAYGITNLLVKCNEEVPVMDGSSLEFCKLIEDAGCLEQDAPVSEIVVNQEISYGEGDEQITISPADCFKIDYELSYPEPVGTQNFSYQLEAETYASEIAPCRTFGFVKDIAHLQGQGLAQGGRFNNFVLIGEDGVVNSELRFPDEAVRHKILDIIGDLYLLGRPLRGHVQAKMTGHSDNIALLGEIKKCF